MGLFSLLNCISPYSTGEKKMNGYRKKLSKPSKKRWAQNLAVDSFLLFIAVMQYDLMKHSCNF